MHNSESVENSQKHQSFHSPSPSRSRSRSKSPSSFSPPIDKMQYEHEHKHEHEREREQYSPRRSRTSSPVASHERGRRENSSLFTKPTTHAEPSSIVGVFGLSQHTHESDLERVFGAIGPLQKASLVKDRLMNSSRGFGFIYFERQEDATRAVEQLNGTTLDGRIIRVDYSTTKRAHSPTPGKYMGRPDQSRERIRHIRMEGRHRRDYDDVEDSDRYRRSSRRRSRSRSRSREGYYRRRHDDDYDRDRRCYNEDDRGYSIRSSRRRSRSRSRSPPLTDRYSHRDSRY